MNDKVSNSSFIFPFKKEIDSDEYRDNFLSKLEIYWKSKKYCDLILDLGGKEFYCHKAVLVCISRYFACLVKYNIQQDKGKLCRLMLPFIDPYNMETILTYIYTGEIIYTMQNLFDVIYTADYFLLDSMLESLSIYLNHYLNIDNIVDFFHISKEIRCQNMYGVTLRFLVRNIYQMHLNKKLSSLTYEDLLKILKDKRLIIHNGALFLFGMEFKKYSIEIIHGWAKCDEINRKIYIPQLVENLNKFVLESLYDKLKLESYRYIEPISRAYFFNSIPFGRHPPSLVSAPFNFRCLSRNIKRTFSDSPPHKWFIKKIILYIIPDWNDVAAIADIQIDYKNCWTGELQAFRAVMDNYIGYIKEEVLLEDDERILEIDIYHGWMIYGMTFYTTSNRVFGIYGSNNAELSRINFQRDYPNALYLHGFAFISISSKDWYAINWLTIYGAMIDKDAYHQDFDCSFEADIDKKIDLKRNVDMSSELKDCAILQFQPENCINELNYPLPHSIEDLFYQWRRYMRIMRLSVIRRHESILSTRYGDSEILESIPGLFSQNHSSPEFSSLNITREI